MSVIGANWLSVAELTQQYCIGPERLLEHARRGNLPCSRDARGVLRYDATVARQLFRTRRAAAITSALPQLGTGFGLVGQLRLGDEQPDRRRRAPARVSSWATAEQPAASQPGRSSAA